MLFSLCRWNLISCQIELGGQFVVASQRTQLFPRGVFDFDTCRLALLLPDILDLARIEHAGGAFGRRRGLEIARELRDFLLEILQRTECRHVEHRHEATVIVPAAGLDAET